MKTKFVLFCLFLLSLRILSQTPNSVQQLPPHQSERVSNIDIKHILLNLKFDWGKKQAFGSAELSLSLKTASNIIYLDGAHLNIQKVTLKNGEKLNYIYDGSEKDNALQITLNKTYTNLDTISVIVYYNTKWKNNIDPNYLSGNNGKGLRFSQPTTNDPLKPNEIWSFGEPQSNRFWFPCYDSPNDLRTTEFIATLDKNLTMVSNGKRRPVKTNPDGTKTWHWKTEIPYANHLTAFVVGEFLDVAESDVENKLTTHNYGSPKEVDWVIASTERLKDMMNYFSKVIGIKYPFEDYSQVFVQDIGSFSGNTGFSTISENMIDDKGTHADFFYLWDQVEAEALAQQWFGNYISIKNWSDAWLIKSLARRMQQLYNCQKNGSDEFLLYQLSFDQSVYFGDWSAGYKHPLYTENYENVYDFNSDNYATYRGNLALNMLHKQLGDAIWWKAILKFANVYAGKQATTKDFENIINTVAQQDLTWFFNQWIYKMGHPVFEATKTYNEKTKELTLTLIQKQMIDSTNKYPQVLYFEGKMEIEIDGKIETINLAAKRENSFKFVLQKKPNFVNIDFSSTWIKELNYENTFDELIAISLYSKDALARQNAFIKLGDIAKNEKTSLADKEKIISVFKQIIVSKAYWRLRVAALFQLRTLLLSLPNKIDANTINMLLKLIATEKSYVKASAINFLGFTQDKKYAPIYISALSDESDRVINLAAIALGKTKDEKAFDALSKLISRPSMKSQSLLSAISGFKELNDVRCFDIIYKVLANTNLPRWRLPDASVWDYRIVAAELIHQIGKSADTYPLIISRFKKSVEEDDLGGIFNNILLINKLADERGQEAFDILKDKYKNDNFLFEATLNYETQFKTQLKK